MAQQIRITVDKQIWDETPWLSFGPLLHGAFSYAAGMVRSPYLNTPVLHNYWDAGWTMAAKGKIRAEIVEEPDEKYIGQTPWTSIRTGVCNSNRVYCYTIKDIFYPANRRRLKKGCKLL